MRAGLAVSLVLLALAGCGRKDAEAPEGKAEGQVLPGSISDAMLPYDTVTSAPPLEAPAAPAPGAYATEGPAGEAALGDDETLPDAAAT